MAVTGSVGFTGSVNEAQWSNLWAPVLPGHVSGCVPTPGGGTRQVTIADGTVWTNGTYHTVTEETVSIGANTSGSSRIDTVVLEADWSSDDATLAVVAGTPGSSPVPPALTQNRGVLWQVPLANVFVANAVSSFVSSDIADVRPQVPGPVTGQILMYGGAVAPQGWLICNGAAVSRWLYPALFSVIGTTFGSGNGSTTFNLPDFTNRTALGGGTRGLKGGSNSRTLSLDNLPSHRHAISHDHPSATTGSGGSHDHELVYSTNGVGNQMSQLPKGAAGTDTNRQAVKPDGNHTHTFDVPSFVGYSGYNGSGSSFDTTPAHTRVHYIIYAGS